MQPSTVVDPMQRIYRITMMTNFKINGRTSQSPGIPDCGNHFSGGYRFARSAKKILGMCINGMIIFSMINDNYIPITPQPSRKNRVTGKYGPDGLPPLGPDNNAFAEEGRTGEGFCIPAISAGDPTGYRYF
jgi:hypothetical protein